MIMVIASKYLSTHFSVEENLGLSFDDVFFSKGGFLVHKNDIFL